MIGHFKKIFCQKPFLIKRHIKNLRSLVTEMFKIKNKLSPPFICDLVKESNIKYQTRSHYSITENEGQQNIDKKHVLTVPKVYKVKTGTESFSNVGPILWNSLPEDVKNADTLASFKSKVKELTFDNCPCTICKTYVQNCSGKWVFEDFLLYEMA